MKEVFIAHRGLHDETIKENSIEAFKKSLEAKLSIELDIHLTKDKKVVVFHDDNLKRLAGVNDYIWNLNYLDLIKIYPVCTLEEVLSLIKGQVYLDIEIKKLKNVFKDLKIIQNILKNYSRYTIKSFNPFISWLYKKNVPSVSCGVLSFSFKNNKMPKFLKRILSNLSYLKIYRPDFISYNVTDYNDAINTLLKKYNIPLSLWTIDSKEKLKKARIYSNIFIFEKIDYPKEK